MVEYILFRGINDGEGHANGLLGLLKGIDYKVNLIPYNETGRGRFKQPEREPVLKFQKILRQKGKFTFIRKEKGADIDAACGQLAGRKP